MNDIRILYRAITLFIASVWMINGLLCKVLNLVPRHQQIVAGILGDAHTSLFTTAIGFAEIGMAIWIVSGFMPRLNAIIQIAVVATMNIIEFIVIPDLLLWGRANALFALLFVVFFHTSPALTRIHLSKKLVVRNILVYPWRLSPCGNFRG
jgi:hypothetical protein